MKSFLLYFLAILVVTVSAPLAAQKVAEGKTIPTVTVLADGAVTEMTVEDFTLRVLLGEKNNFTEKETAKALAVAARSCGLYLSVFGCKHGDFDLCDNGDCCFELGSPESADEETLSLCKTAVEETFGQALTIDRLPAMSLFTLCAGSATAECKEFTYLTAAAEETRCEIHKTENIRPYSSLEGLIGINADYNNLKEHSVIVYDSFGECCFGVFGDKYFTGEEIRSALNLESTEFSIEFTESGIKTLSYGSGNGYGMSLCGAEAKARAGKSYIEIIEHYYPNLVLNNIYNN